MLSGLSLMLLAGAAEGATATQASGPLRQSRLLDASVRQVVGQEVVQLAL